MRTDETAVGMAATRHSPASAGIPANASLRASLSVGDRMKVPTPWDPAREEAKLALLHPLDRFAEGALEIGVLLAVLALFLPVLV
jgi:hypothetical protein